MKELTGKGSPFHSALDKAASLLKRNVGTGMEFMQELGKIPGVKKEEIEDRKLHEIMGMPKMTREQFLGALQSRPAPAIKEKVLGEKLSRQELAKETNDFIRAQARRYASENSDNSREYRILAGDEMRRLRNNPEVPAYVASVVKEDYVPHHKQWTLPGGENYREMLIKSPKGAEQFPGNPAHFGGEPGILASMRLKDRTGPNGEKLLHLEELQSDWHQQGREKGYGNTVNEQGHFNVGVPDAPFKKNWEEMALKRLIHHAAENGYHGIVVTPGAEQADRYSLANVIDEINVIGRTHAGTGEKTRIVALDTVDGKSLRLGVNNDGVVDNVSDPTIQNFMGKNLSEVVGKDVAKNIMSGGTQTISGEGLTVGGEGMKAFYDKKVPNILNSVGKKHGVKTQLHGHAIEVGEKMVPDRAGLGMIRSGEPDQKQLHHFPITEEMRQDVLQNGLPLYAEGGEVHMADGGSIGENNDAPTTSPKQGVKVNPSIAQMKLALATKGNPLNVQSIGANEAPSMSPKTYLPPDTQQGQYVPPGGAATPSGLAVGGVDMNSMQPGNQLMPGGLQPLQPPAPAQQPQQAPQQAPQLGQPAQPPGGSNILQMTPQGRAMAAISPNPPQGMADGGSMHEKSSRLKQMLEQKFSPQAIKASEALGQHEGKTLHVTQSDRTKVGGGFLGGPGFSSLQHVDPDYANLVWGVNSPGAASRIINTSAEYPEGKALWSTMIGAPTQHSSNQMVFNMLLKEFKKGIKAGKLKPETRAAINQILATSVDNEGNPIFGNRVDISGKNFFENLNTFDKRRVMADLMGGVRVGGKKGQVFDYDKIIQQTTEPELLGAPTHAIGPRLFTATGERSYRPELHPAFPHMVHGEDLGVMYHPVPKEVMLPEFHERIKKEKGRNVGYMDLTRNVPSQFLSENFLTQLQKRGHKKGGNVNQDTMFLELSKRKKAK